MNKLELLELAISWARVGLFGFGGGPGMIPLMMAECVESRPQWNISEDEFTEALALCGLLPGPISAKMSLWVGFRVAGLPGAAVAFVMVMAPALVLMASLMTLYMRTRQWSTAQGAMAAAKPAVVGLLAWVVFKLGTNNVVDWSGAAIAIAAFTALFFKVHPAVVMGFALAIGALLMRVPQ